MNDKDTAVQQLKDLVEKFRSERDWGEASFSKKPGRFYCY